MVDVCTNTLSILAGIVLIVLYLLIALIMWAWTKITNTK